MIENHGIHKSKSENVQFSQVLYCTSNTFKFVDVMFSLYICSPCLQKAFGLLHCIRTKKIPNITRLHYHCTRNCTKC